MRKIKVSRKGIDSKSWLKLRKVARQGYFEQGDRALFEGYFGSIARWLSYGDLGGTLCVCGVHYLVDKLRYGVYRVYTIKHNRPVRRGNRDRWKSELWTFR